MIKYLEKENELVCTNYINEILWKIDMNTFIFYSKKYNDNIESLEIIDFTEIEYDDITSRIFDMLITFKFLKDKNIKKIIKLFCYNKTVQNMCKYIINNININISNIKYLLPYDSLSDIDKECFKIIGYYEFFLDSYIKNKEIFIFVFREVLKDENCKFRWSEMFISRKILKEWYLIEKLYDLCNLNDLIIYLKNIENIKQWLLYLKLNYKISNDFLLFPHIHTIKNTISLLQSNIIIIEKYIGS